MSSGRDVVGRKKAFMPIESFGIGRVITDMDFRITEISEESARLLGGNSDQLLSRQLSVDLGPKREVLEDAANGTIQLSECITADGTKANACFRVLKLNGKDGAAFEGYDVLFLKESGELKCSGSESVHFHEVLSELDENRNHTVFLEKLLESVGHDLKTPIGVILGYCELVFKTKQGSLPGDNERVLKTIYKNCAWIADMVEQLELFSSLVRRGKEEQKESVSLSEQLKDTSARLSKTAFSSQVKLNLGHIEEIEVFTSPILLSTVLDEIFKNAILYCKKEREIEISLHKNKGNAKVVVEIQSLEEDFSSISHIADRLFIQPPDFHREPKDMKLSCLGLGAVRHLGILLGSSISAVKSANESACLILEMPCQNQPG
jgi:K+-sensing histidine kinase KdpD